MRIADFDAMTFDCYGTLVDWEAGILDALAPWRRRERLDADDEQILAAFAESEPAIQRDRPDALYTDVLRAVAGTIAERFGAPMRNDDANRLAVSIARWPVFSDAHESLPRLKRRCRLFIVSNVDRASFARTNEALAVDFDAVVTAQDVGAYKPDLRMFEAAIDEARRCGVQRERILHVAQSLYHDLEPARRLGLRTCFIDRRAGRPGGAARPPETAVTPDFTFTSLAKLADAADNANGRHA